MTNIILIGPHGSGKGYISNRIIADNEHIKHLSTGVILRECNDEEVQSKLKKEQMVSDDLIIKIVTDTIKNSSTCLLLDGFPRNLLQAQSLNLEFVKLVIVLEVDDDVCLERITNRQDGREDDTDKNIVKSRIKMYHEVTLPVIDYYKDKATVCFVDGNGNKENVYSQIQEILTQNKI